MAAAKRQMFCARASRHVRGLFILGLGIRDLTVIRYNGDRLPSPFSSYQLSRGPKWTADIDVGITCIQKYEICPMFDVRCSAKFFSPLIKWPSLLELQNVTLSVRMMHNFEKHN